MIGLVQNKILQLAMFREHKYIMNNLAIVDTFAKIDSIMSEYKNKNWRVAYSGGSDSDTVMWLFRYCGYEPHGVFYNTGLEYAATLNHINWMRDQNFEIETIKVKYSIPTSQKKYGHPFISKFVSDMLSRLQRHDFDFYRDGSKSFDELFQLYPKCKSALRWWTDTHKGRSNNISWNKNLKEFLIEYGLPFRVSEKCCDGAKKLPIKKYTKINDIDLMILGIRKAEGGKRSSTYKNCFIPKNTYTYSMYFPLFWWKKEDKISFDIEVGVKHSACYSEYGLERTGCAGCPFGVNFELELESAYKFEPKLYKGIKSIFNDSYEWTRKYKQYQKEKKESLLINDLPMFNNIDAI